MRMRTRRLLLGLLCCSILSARLFAQNGYSTGLNGRVFDLPCNQNCLNETLRIPHLKTSSNYSVGAIPYAPYAYTTAGGNELVGIYDDDVYSGKITMPFPFCFYDSLFSKIVVGSNGILTFDTANAGCENAWAVTQQIPFSSNSICDDQAVYYPKAAIMLNYTDLDARVVASPADRKIEWRVEGTAPFRRFIVSYFHIGVYGDPCGLTRPGTFQAVLYESSGIIEIYVDEKICNSASSQGRAIMGIQNWERNRALAPAGKNNTVWTESRTAYRFLPSGPVSRFVRCEVLDFTTGAVLYTGDTATTTQGLLDVSFPAFCVPGTTGQYVIRSVFSGCDIPGNEIIALDTITINKTNSLNATFITTPTSCGITGTGTATIFVPTGIGTGPYTYSLSPGNTVTTPDRTMIFNNLTAGNYTATITDASGICVSPLTFTVATTGVLAVSFTAVNTTCVGAANGSITVDPPNGTPPITYSIGSGPFSTSNSFTGLAAATYFLNVRDAAGCTANNIPVVINAGPAITMTTAATPTSCPGLNNGTITVTPTTGTAPFTYSINGGGYQPNPTFSGLAPGNYFISMRDAVGCTVIFQQQQVAQGNATITGTAVGTATSCAGAVDGSITITPSGTGPYEYSINNGINWQSSNVFNGLAVGTYTALIREGGACTSSNISVTIAAGPAINVLVTTTSTACSGVNNGSVTIDPAAGQTGPFEYALDGGVFQSGNVFTGVSAGTHTVAVRNAAGCSSGNITVQVLAGTALTGTVAPTAITCNGLSNGVITVTPTNGSPPYFYSLNGGPPQASNIFNGLGAGSYDIIIRDAFGCVSQAYFTSITQPGVLVAGDVQVNPVVCNGEMNGSIVVTNTRGGTAPYAFSIDNTNFGPSSQFQVGPGTYSLYVRDANGCTARIDNIVVTEPSPVTITTITLSNATCDNNGTIELIAGGGVGSYQYSANGINFQSSNILQVPSGPYNVVVRDAAGCESRVNAIVGLTNNVNLSVGTPPPICEGSNIQLQATSNATAYTWSAGDGQLNNAIVSNPVASPAATTTYTVTASLGACSRSADVTVTVLPAPQPDAGPDGNICFGQDFRLQGSGGVSYSWTPSVYLDNNTLASPMAISPERTTTYSLSIIGANNCPSVVPDEMTLHVTPPIKITFSPEDTVVHAGAQFQLTATSAGTDYTWTPATGLNNPLIANPLVTAPAVGTEVIYHVIATTSAGCRGDGYATVRVYAGPEVYVPNAFTPNQDGRNDLFMPFPVGIKKLDYFRVFNRWGQLLFSTSSLHHGWDGRMGGAEQASGMYVWMLQAVTAEGKTISKRGTVMLVR